MLLKECPAMREISRAMLFLQRLARYSASLRSPPPLGGHGPSTRCVRDNTAGDDLAGWVHDVCRPTCETAVEVFVNQRGFSRRSHWEVCRGCAERCNRAAALRRQRVLERS